MVYPGFRDRCSFQQAADPSWQAAGSGEAYISLFENRLTGHGRAWGSGLEGMLTALCHYLQGDLLPALREPWPSTQEPVVRQVVESAASYLPRREARSYVSKASGRAAFPCWNGATMAWVISCAASWSFEQRRG